MALRKRMRGSGLGLPSPKFGLGGSGGAGNASGKGYFRLEGKEGLLSGLGIGGGGATEKSD